MSSFSRQGANKLKMPIISNITLDAAVFHPNSVSEETEEINDMIEKITTIGPRWWEVGAAKYRKMRESGETPFPVPVYLPAAWDTTVPSRDFVRDISLRVYSPDNGEASKGVILHFHPGGWVIGSQKQ